MRIKQNILYLAYRLGIFLTIYCSEKTAYWLANIYARLWYIWDYKRKNNIKNHLLNLLKYQDIYPDKADINRLIYQSFLNFSYYLVELFRLPLVNKEYIKNKIIPGYTTELDKILSDKKGVILFTAHFGNWELAGVGMSILGYPMTVIARKHSNPHINELFISRRKQHGLEIIELNQYAAKKCIQILHEGKILSLVGDKDFTDNPIILDYLGEKIKAPRGPAILSRITGAPVIPLVLIRQQNNSFIFYIEKAIYPIRTAHKEDDIRQMTQYYLNSLAPYFKQYPAQWFRE